MLKEINFHVVVYNTFHVAERKGLARLDSRDFGSFHPKTTSASKLRPPPSPSPSLSSSQGRSNPFRVGSPGKKASGVHGKSFFDSVEEDKKALLLRKTKIREYMCYSAWLEFCLSCPVYATPEKF